MALNFSDSDKAKYMTGQYRKEIKLYFPQLSLTVLNGQIYGESLSLEEAIFDGNGELSIIGCISNRFSIEIRNQGVQLKNKTIQVSIRIDNGSWNRIFTGYVDSVETVRDRSYQKLMCYDALYKYQDKNFFDTYDALTFPVTIKTLRDAIFSFIGISQESTTLVNDGVSIPQTIEDGELAVIDALRAVCQMNGVFGKIDASGVFKYVDVDLPSEFLPYPDDELYPNADLYPANPSQETIYIDKYRTITYEDYEVARITGVTVRDGSSDVNSGSYDTALFANTLLIEGNIWCNGLDQMTKEAIAENIYNKVQYIVYQPFESVSVGLPYVECGDAVAFYVYDYSTGSPVTHIMGFSIMSRYLKGIQWMTDQYVARGDEYQPEVISEFGQSSPEGEINNLKTEIEKTKDDIDDLMRGKQNYIDQDLLVPSGSGQEGDLCFYGVSQTGFKGLYRYENGEWVKVLFIDSGENGPAYGEHGDVYIQHDGEHIIDILMKNQELWMPLSITGEHRYLSAEHKVGTWINDNDVFERTYKLNSLPSNETAQYVHNIGGFGLILYAKGMKNENNKFTDLACDNEVSVDGTHIILKSTKAQSGNAYITIGYTKPVGGYYTNNQYYMKNTGNVCTGWYASSVKTVAGDCYCGMIVGGVLGGYMAWTTFCLSLLRETVEGMQYRYQTDVGVIEWNNQTWYYSVSQVEQSYASSTTIDNTQPPERRFYIGAYTGDFVTTALTKLLDAIYT